ncbi:FAD-binding oxidoreductase [Streptomyces phaeolivaceus]|uniref:FAD-binding oxidoreductase n=1 Tax=Streptomyces phaeolivaceus TaxID=2653200 RepID=A0A5P8KER8_9ACTN|nr:FAD-binding oxidoreductase [Streptomyces phaeolivaceus]QFR01642.1 FAD-binding oxidoreductase [Streptomyces phaeolivaceus]
MDRHRFDVLVIGGGVAGVSLGCEIAETRSVGLLEMESTLAYHTTGRSAAVFVESLGSGVIRALTRAAKPVLLDPPDTFASPPLSPLPMLTVAAAGRGDELREYHAEVLEHVPDAVLLDGPGAVRQNPLLAPGHTELAMYEPGAMEIDVHAVHQGYLRGLRRRGGVVHTSSGVVRAVREHGVWRVTVRGGAEFEAPVVVDAAGAWADEVAGVFGARPVGLRPLRRSIFTVRAPEGVVPAGLPLTADFDSAFYFKPEGEQFLCSPVEEVPHVPADVRPDELEIARALDALNEATVLKARSVRSQWAGLRSFVADRAPVVGFDPECEGFFWFAGQGGYGIQIAPALARCGAALFGEGGLPPELSAAGLDAAALSPARPSLEGQLT